MKNKYLLVLIVLLFTSLLNYWRVPLLFWQQDEWVTLANLTQSGVNIIWHGLDVKSTHFAPISNFIAYLCFRVFGFNYSGYLIVGLLFHLINGFLIFKIAQNLKLNLIFSLFTAIFFVGSSASYQLLMWPIISLNSIALTFSLLATIALINFVVKKEKPFYWGSIVVFFIALALFTIEYSAAMVLFIPLALFLFHKRLGITKIIIFLIPLMFLTFFYAGFRFHYATPLNTIVTSNTNQSSQFNKFFYPFYYLGQIYTPEIIIVQTSKLISSIRSEINENSLLFPLAFISNVLFILMTVFILSKVDIKENSNLFKIILLSFLFIFLSSVPFILVSGNLTILPSRYLYFGSAASSLLFSSLLYLSHKNKLKYTFRTLLFVLVGLILFSLFQNFQKSKELYDKGQTRKLILNTIEQRYPKLPIKTVFYIQSDSSYYGLPPEEKIPPFQGGLGHILLIWYYNKSNFPTDFYLNEYLWEIKSEKYMEIGEYGYGYFRNFDKLQKVVYQYNLSPESVIAFSWKGRTNKLEDITPEVRRKLTSQL